MELLEASEVPEVLGVLRVMRCVLLHMLKAVESRLAGGARRAGGAALRATLLAGRRVSASSCQDASRKNVHSPTTAEDMFVVCITRDGSVISTFLNLCVLDASRNLMLNDSPPATLQLSLLAAMFGFIARKERQQISHVCVQLRGKVQQHGRYRLRETG